MPDVQSLETKVPFNRIVCADCRNFLARLPDQCVDLIVASPQLRTYRDRSPLQSNRGAYEGALKILNPFLTEQSEVLKEGSRVLKSTGSILWHVGVFHERGVSIPLDVEIYSILENLGLVPRGRIVIVRHRALDPQPHEEFVSIDGYSTFTWFSKSEHFKYEPNSGPHAVRPGAGQIIWVPPERSGTCENIHHPAQDCEGIIARIVASTTAEDDLVLDPYMGSGTTAVAAIKLKRRFMGSEIDAKYIEIARKRLDELRPFAQGEWQMSDEDTREVIIHTPQGRPLLLQNGDIFSAAGTNVARVLGNVAYDPSGRYVGTIVDDRLVFDDTDSLTAGPLFVRTTHPGFADVESISVKTLEREIALCD